MDNTTNSILSDIALALNDHNEFMAVSGHFVDLTTGAVTFVPEDILMAEDLDDEDISDYEDWEQEIIHTYLEHELIPINPIPSYESFRVMVTFMQSRTDAREIRYMQSALSKRKPFSNFKTAVGALGILEEWYACKNEAGSAVA